MRLQRRGYSGDASSVLTAGSHATGIYTQAGLQARQWILNTATQRVAIRVYHDITLLLNLNARLKG